MIIEPAFDIAREIFQPAAQHVKILTEVFNCKTRYSTCRTVLDQIGAHGLNTVAWRWALPSSPTPSACRLRGSRAGTAPPRQARDGTYAVLPEICPLLSFV